jgi:hypothetical protein
MDADTPPEKVAAARIIYAYLMNLAAYAQFVPAARKAVAAEAVIMAQPPDIAEHRWGAEAGRQSQRLRLRVFLQRRSRTS